MKKMKWLIIGAALLGLTGFAAFSHHCSADDKSVIPDEQMAFVKEVKQFSQNFLAMKPSGNFEKYKAEGKPEFIFYAVSEKNGSPDKLEIYEFFDSEKEMMEAFDEYKNKGYSVYTRIELSCSGGDRPASQELLKQKKEYQAFTVLHEEFHEQICISEYQGEGIPIQEAMANLVGFVGAIEFFEARGESEKALRQWQDWQRYAKEINRLAEEIAKINQEKINDQEKAAKRQAILFSSSYTITNLAHLASARLYTKYLDSTLKIYEISGKDLKKTIQNFIALLNKDTETFFKNIL